MIIDETKRLNISLLERKDLEAARALHNEHSTLLQLHNPNHVTEQAQEKWFKSLCESQSSARYALYEKESQKFVGVFRSDRLDLRNGSVMIGLDIAIDQRGKGFSKEAYKWFLDYYFQHLRMHRVYLEVLESNEIAKSLYEKLGFSQEGILRDAVYRDGKYTASIVMSILSNEYLSIKGKK